MPRPFLITPTMNHWPYRASIRLPGYDYTQTGAYFITICAHERQCSFGVITDGVMRLNGAGEIIGRCWHDIPRHFPQAVAADMVIMPNHFHGILLIPHPTGAACRAPTPERFGKAVPGSIPTIVRSFKSAVSRHINASLATPGAMVWQRNYYEHIIRNERDLLKIIEYIETNPQKWQLDKLYRR